MVDIYIKKIMHNMICVTGVYSREVVNIFFDGQVFRLVENFNTGSYRHHKRDKCKTLHVGTAH